VNEPVPGGVPEGDAPGSGAPESDASDNGAAGGADPSRAMTERPSWPRALLRMLALRGGELPAHAGPVLLLVLALAPIALWIAIDLLLFEQAVVFYPDDGVPAMACYALAVLALATILARASRPVADFARVLALVLAGTLLAVAITQAVAAWVPPVWTTLAGLVAAVYLLVVAMRALRLLTGSHQPRAILLAVLALLAFRWADQALYLQPSVWAELPPEEEATEQAHEELSWGDAERIQFEQSRRIDRAVAALAPPDPLQASVYFVGFAGVAEQRVFAEEIGLAARVVEQRYHATGRELLLVNDRRDLERAPFASPTALRYTLRALAARMRPQRDILFLALSSHGSKESIAVSNGDFLLHDLRAEDLAAALEDSGIGWRVIVISACHAGSFIDALRDSRTIVLTAAAADRTSFGCADDRDLTYFGEAFWRDALPRAATLRDAFDTARAAIARRESSEGIEASHPQAWFGEEIEAKLAALEETQSLAQH
jgi:hypothetical protein